MLGGRLKERYVVSEKTEVMYEGQGVLVFGEEFFA
jgi:hypothetical protein